MINCLHPVWKNPIILSSTNSPFFNNLRSTKQLNYGKKSRLYSKRSRIVCGFLPVDPWAPNVDSQSIASQLFAFSIFPYVGFLYFITKSKTAPKLTLFGFYFLLAFVGATIPAGIYAKVHYGTSLSNVDWLHGGAESLLTLTNLFIVLGLREAIRKAENPEASKTDDVSRIKEEKKSSI
ncbi:hypothetical protein BC332_20352 [Capsicum chinense]|uniref:1-acyl-sn-glycerol-3-phosphate acyltransferase delta n=1 Tax=Capsicum annuum TaxID=4072 RepID=A0A1U8EYW5_CAPAN|nr:uncharacterized protein LOC107851729 [Capsicum annuum]KAF3628371.1 WRKY transcription factor 53 family protein [Capsicum annuum]KAF3652180.1 WRKY transcription factor 53 family protein [Capsicum annuum]PHT96048.1 hypothetical protein T459_03930 [Capsicum annuum]PHU08492.1 hypothetical protein BC332_20352 [Capsicum chinense]